MVEDEMRDTRDNSIFYSQEIDGYYLGIVTCRSLLHPNHFRSVGKYKKTLKIVDVNETMFTGYKSPVACRWHAVVVIVDSH